MSDQTSYVRFCSVLAEVFVSLTSEFPELENKLMQLAAILTKDNRSQDIREIRGSFLALCRGTEHIGNLFPKKDQDRELEKLYLGWCASFSEYPRINLGTKGLTRRELMILDSRKFRRYLKAALESVDLHTMS